MLRAVGPIVYVSKVQLWRDAAIEPKSRKCLNLSRFLTSRRDEAVALWCNGADLKVWCPLQAFKILNMSRKPLVGISADRRLSGKHPYHMVGEKYIEAVSVGAGAVPVLVPALGRTTDWLRLLDAC